MSILNHPFFTNCHTLIYDECTKLFESTNKSWMEKARSSFAMEYAAMQSGEMAPSFYLAKSIINHAREQGRFVLTVGDVSCSFLAYLYGLIETDPVNSGYPPEIAFGWNMDWTPHIHFAIPAGLSDEIRMYLESIFDPALIRQVNENVLKIGDKEDEEKFSYLLVSYSDDPICTWVEDAIRKDGKKNPNLDEIKTAASEKEEEKIEKEGEKNLSFRLDLPSEKEDEKILKRIRELVIRYASEFPADDEIQMDPDRFLEEMPVDTFDGLVRAIAAIRGSGVYAANAGFYKAGHGRDIAGLFTREDIYRYGGMIAGDNKIDGYILMEYARKGRGGEERIREFLEKNGKSEDIERFAKMQYVVCEGECVAIARLIRMLAERE